MSRADYYMQRKLSRGGLAEGDAKTQEDGDASKDHGAYAEVGENGQYRYQRKGAQGHGHFAMSSGRAGKIGNNKVEDNEDMCDLLARNNTQVGGIIYTGELQQRAFGTVAEGQDSVPCMSQQWHRVLWIVHRIVGDDIGSCRTGGKPSSGGK
jgi:hypothetical protein